MNPRRQNEPALFKSSNKKVAVAREKNEGEKSDDTNFERASNVENDDMGAYNNTSQHYLGVDNSHLSLQNKENLNNEALADEFKSNLNANHKEVPTCVECGRTFPSVKAMHGHLRSHPNRGYKGAVPPPNMAKKQLVQPSSTSAPQVEIPASKRPVRPRRDPNRIIDPTTEAINAAFMLVYLSIETSKQSASPSHENETYRSPKRKRESIEDDFRVIHDKEETANEGSEGDDHFGGHQIDCDYDGEYIEESHLQPLSNLIEKRKKKAKKSAGSYPCGVCNKIFPTHQALGGHMASHNKGKNIMDEAFTANEANEVELSHVEKLTVETASKGPNLGIHKCKKCGQIFASGQALGGHQRKHYPLPDHSQKECNVSLNQDRKKSNVAPDHGWKKRLPNNSQKESNDVSDDRRKECNDVPDHGQEKSNVMFNIDLNKSVDFNQDLPS
ncbi:zinc finger protein ZAT3-like [Ananas comosus]|uniref:Zinc finger protein ZAT3-like n=1 Tax=Ananas comosus TaxID=4615 RepID=A0A6P5EQ43_ANACO|nr:zinc finger protein ZAT3-like [Ananas comosus]